MENKVSFMDIFNGKKEDLVLSKLVEIFKENNFSILVNLEKSNKYVSGEGDMFLKYADKYKQYIVYDNSKCILDMYLLDELGDTLYYISYAEFEKYSGCKYGTKVVGAISELGISKAIRISDRSLVIGPGESVWSRIVSKFSNLEYHEV